MKTTFTYNPASLSAEQREAIAEAQNAYNEVINAVSEDESRVAEHYYDAMDDYAYGNPLMEKSFAARRARAEQNLNDRVQEIVNGYIIRVRRCNIRRNLSGEIVANGTHEGKYGRYFKTYDGKFISCAKRIATYEKKGFRPFVQEVTEKVRRAGFFSNGDAKYESVGIVSINETLSTEICY